ncbi:hypothetical protein BH10PSE19_BH10PSE19_13360 [soil metagenome]
MGAAKIHPDPPTKNTPPPDVSITISDDHPSSPPNIAAQKKKASIFGTGIAWLYCIGYSLVITVFFSYLALLPSFDSIGGWVGKVGLGGLLAAVFGIECYIHRNLYLTSVPAIFTKKFWQDAVSSENSDGQRVWHSKARLAFSAFGLLLAITGGVALAALTFNKSAEATAAIIKIIGTIGGVAGLSFPPLGFAIGSLLAVAAFFAFTGLIFKWVVKIAKEGYFEGLFKFCRELRDGKDGMTLTRVRLEGFFKVVIIAAMLTAAVFGMIATLGTTQIGLEAFFNARGMEAVASKLASSIVVYGGMALVRLPWVIHSIASAFSRAIDWIGERIHNYRNNIPSNINSKEIAQNFLEAAAHGFIYHPFTGHGGEAINDVTGLPAADATIAAQVTGGIMAGGVGVYAIQQKATLFATGNKHVGDPLLPPTTPLSVPDQVRKGAY